MSQTSQPWVNKSIWSRWIDTVLYAAACLIAFELLLPVGTRLFKIDPPLAGYQPWFALSASAIAVAVLVFVVAEPIKIRRGHWARLHRYPPLWFAPVLAISAALGLSTPATRYQPLQAPPDWAHAWVILPIALTFGFAVALRQIPWQRPRAQPEAEPVAVDLMAWETLRKWFAAEEPTERDFFGHSPISDRIARTLVDQSCEQAIALLGPFGSGKSSILRRVRLKVEEVKTPLVIIAEFNGWAVPDPVDAPRVALDRMVEALGRFIDPQRLRGLPDAYKRLVSAEPSGLLEKLLGAKNESDPLTHLKQLEGILEALGARMILFIEDADRAGGQFDSRHLERLLMTLREVKGVSFVLSIDAAQGPRFDYRKLCDVIEIVPKLDPEYVYKLLGAAYRHWIARPFIDPRPKHESPLGLDQEAHQLVSFYRRMAQDSPAHALTNLVSSPRRLKHVIRRVDRIWSQLVGEVDLDDLIIITVLRDLDDRQVFEFLSENIDAARAN